MRAILTSFGTEGAIAPFAALAAALVRRGHQVSLLTNHRHCARFAGLGCELVPLDTEEEFRAFVRDGYQMFTPDRVPGLFRRYYLPKLQSEVSLISERLDPSCPCVIVTSETPGLAARVAAESLQVPLVSVLIQPNHISTQDLLKSLIGSVLRDEINRQRGERGLAPRRDLSTWWSEVDRYLALWPDWFAPEFCSWPRTSYAGLLGYEGDGQSPGWFQRERSAPSILITGGTAHLASLAFFASLCEALSGAPGDKVLLCSQPEMVPPTITPDIRVVSWVDSFRAALRDVDILIHHGGLGTISQALAAGTPQLVLADGGDRPENGRFIEALGVGLFLPRTRWTPQDIRGAVEYISRNPSIRRRCAELAARCNAERAEAAGALCIEETAALPGRADSRRLPMNAETQPPIGQGSDALLGRVADLSAQKNALLMTKVRAALQQRRHLSERNEA